ncbi:hypothetical protein DLAC_02042 [Tieghemostelium lacteum]|uniref:Uncharacterized protein n=1 Tax=Tieghemostelium lacteum TaxID=361077 RepID=A0A152A511_TIELA|nr:hypothetical protein DLAC_02042 [Tieghemostelium lacteum]|eukprot:KYR01320.1 hypothetical protein DLAC_02042 [Tieghemostelium lacteum]
MSKESVIPHHSTKVGNPTSTTNTSTTIMVIDKTIPNFNGHTVHLHQDPYNTGVYVHTLPPTVGMVWPPKAPVYPATQPNQIYPNPTQFPVYPPTNQKDPFPVYPPINPQTVMPIQLPNSNTKNSKSTVNTATPTTVNHDKKPLLSQDEDDDENSVVVFDKQEKYKL